MPRITLDHQHPALPQLAEQGAMLAHEAIVESNDRHRAAQNFQLDFAANPPYIRFEGIGATYHAQFLGSFSGIDDTWMWGWNNINNYPETAIEVAQNVHQFGEMANVPEFTQPVLTIQGDADIHRLMFAVVRLTGRPAFHRARTEHGHVYYLLHDYQLQPTRGAATQHAIAAAIDGRWIINHQTSLDAYIEMRPLNFTDTENGKRLHCSDGDVDLGFDAQGRITSYRFRINEQASRGLRDGQSR